VPFVLGDAGITLPKRDLDRLTKLNQKVQAKGCRCAVIEVPAAAAPF